MSDFFLILSLCGGFAVGFLTACFLLLPLARRYLGRRRLIVAGLLPTASVFALNYIPRVTWLEFHGVPVVCALAVGVSLLLLVWANARPGLPPPAVHPVAPTLVLLAANAWNIFLLVEASDPCFMGGCC